jgi:hypothetical protein
MMCLTAVHFRPKENSLKMSSKKKNATPRWATHTPAPNDHDPRGFEGHSMIMWSNDDVGAEEIYLTRDEYIALKRELARRRGYKLPPLAGKPRHQKSAA